MSCSCNHIDIVIINRFEGLKPIHPIIWLSQSVILEWLLSTLLVCSIPWHTDWATVGEAWAAGLNVLPSFLVAPVVVVLVVVWRSDSSLKIFLGVIRYFFYYSFVFKENIPLLILIIIYKKILTSTLHWIVSVPAFWQSAWSPISFVIIFNLPFPASLLSRYLDSCCGWLWLLHVPVRTGYY